VGKKKKQELSNRTTYGIVAAVVVILLLIIFLQGKKDYAPLATCLADEGYVMAGTEWCSHCKTQKQLFKGAFEEVIIPAGAYQDCDRNKDWCDEAGVQGYPTWVTPDGNLLTGTQSLSTLAKISGCTI
jgi:hypothetical protein